MLDVGDRRCLRPPPLVKDGLSNLGWVSSLTPLSNQRSVPVLDSPVGVRFLSITTGTEYLSTCGLQTIASGVQSHWSWFSFMFSWARSHHLALHPLAPSLFITPSVCPNGGNPNWGLLKLKVCPASKNQDSSEKNGASAPVESAREGFPLIAQCKRKISCRKLRINEL